MMRPSRLDPFRPVLYLDYDGVLHSDEVYWYRKKGIVVTGDHGLFAAAEILETIVAPYTAYKLFFQQAGYAYLLTTKPPNAFLPTFGAGYEAQHGIAT